MSWQNSPEVSLLSQLLCQAQESIKDGAALVVHSQEPLTENTAKTNLVPLRLFI